MTPSLQDYIAHKGREKASNAKPAMPASRRQVRELTLPTLPMSTLAAIHTCLARGSTARAGPLGG